VETGTGCSALWYVNDRALYFKKTNLPALPSIDESEATDLPAVSEYFSAVDVL